MDIHRTRWFNARALHVLYGNESYSELARSLGKDIGLCQKWFNRKKLTKTIGTAIAREIETAFQKLIATQAGGDQPTGWLDMVHYDLWEKLLKYQVQGGQSVADHYSLDEIKRAVTTIITRLQARGVMISAEHCAELVCKILPVLSDDELTHSLGLDDLDDDIKRAKKQLKSNQ